jgi:hypothetical protein
MLTNRRDFAGAGSFSLKWAPVVLRFFQLFVGDQPTAEVLTIDTLADHAHHSGPGSESEVAIPLLRRALAKALATKPLSTQSADPLVRAVTQLEPMRRAAIVLHRGLSLDIDVVARITGRDRDGTRRICVEALKELHLRLSSGPAPVRIVSGRLSCAHREAK